METTMQCENFMVLKQLFILLKLVCCFLFSSIDNPWKIMTNGVFWVFPKITFANWSKSNHDAIIIPVPPAPLNLKSLERKENTTNIWVFREQKELFRWNKKRFSQFWKCFLLVKHKKIEEKIFKFELIYTTPSIIY